MSCSRQRSGSWRTNPCHTDQCCLQGMLLYNFLHAGVSPCSPAASAVPAASSASAWLQPACWLHAWKATWLHVRPGGAVRSTCCIGITGSRMLDAGLVAAIKPLETCAHLFCGRSVRSPHLRFLLFCSSMFRVMMSLASSRRHAASRCSSAGSP